MSKTKGITAGILFLLLLIVWGCHSTQKIELSKDFSEQEEQETSVSPNNRPESVSPEGDNQGTASTEESSITITGKVVIFAKGTKSETITLEVIQDNQKAINYTLVGSLGYSLKSREGEVVTVIGHLTDGGFSIVPGPHLWVDEIKEE